MIIFLLKKHLESYSEALLFYGPLAIIIILNISFFTLTALKIKSTHTIAQKSYRTTFRDESENEE